MMFGENMEAPVRKVRHAELKRQGDSLFRSDCPACERGVLPVNRHQETFALLRIDRCVLCGQVFEYLDADIAGFPLT